MMEKRRCLPRIIAPVSILICFNAAPAGAHGFGQRYDLPIPLSFYLWGAGAAVAFSFVIFALFLTAERAARPLPSRARTIKGSAYTAGFVVATILRAAGVVLFLLVVVAGLVGDQNPVKNPAPAMIWIIGWVGISFASALFGNVWQLLNPWDGLFRLAEWIFPAVGRAEPGARRLYPARLGVWPAFVLFIAFAWMELVWPGRDVPAQLAGALIIYSVVTWTGMVLFGRATWLARGEVFAIAFGIFARFAPVAWPRMPADPLELRLPASGLLEEQPLPPSMVALVIALLATVTFDGFLETPLWARVDVAILNSPLESPLWTTFNLREEEALRWARTLALPCFVVLFLAGYLLVCRWMSALTRDRALGARPALGADPALGASPALGAGPLARRFVLSLVPISLAYHVAHYFSYLLVDGQYVIPILSDPLGRGWDLFGTASYQVDIGLVDPWLQWSVAVVAVVLGHIIAVYLAHVTALRLFRDTGTALVSQIPMVLLMVGYTMCSLWILSQPIVETTG